MELKSRHEKFARIRKILSAHFVLLDELTITCSYKSVIFSGFLLKRDHSDFTVQELKVLLAEINRVVPQVSSQLENWDLNNDEVRKLKVTNKEPSRPQGLFHHNHDLSIELD